MPTLKKELPYAWFWLGKPLHKGHSRGERLRPIYVNRDGELYTVSRGSSRASLSVEKPRRAFELHQDQSRATSPSRSERVNQPIRKFCGVCSPVETEPEIPVQAKLQCPCCQKSPSPLRPNGPAQTPSKNVVPAPYYYHVCPLAGVQTVTPIIHDHSHGYQTPTPAPSPQVPAQGETTRGKSPQAKCTCCQTVPSPEPETRRHACIHSDECRGDCLFVDVSLPDDTLSEASVEVNSESDRGEECVCGHLVFAVPYGAVH